MKTTGIVRQVDNLGRIVIPKAIRKTLNIQDGDTFEIFIDVKEGSVCFKPYHIHMEDSENDYPMAKMVYIQ